MSFDATSRRDSLSYHTPRQSVTCSSFGSPFASEEPFSQSQPALASGLLRAGSGSASTASMHSRGSATAQAIIEGTQALEAELLKLRQSHEEKDREIAGLRASLALTALVDQGACDRAPEDPDTRPSKSFADGVKADKAEAYSLLSPAFGHLRRAYAKTCSLPLVGGVARAGLWTADACVSRATKWASCEEVGDDVDGLLQYVDQQVFTPHLLAARSGSLALCEPALRKVDPLLARSSALLAGLRAAPRGFVQALGRRATAPAVWLRDALRAWYGTPPGRLAMEDRLSRSAEAASAKVAAKAVVTNGGTGGVGNGEDVAAEDLAAEASHD